MKEEELRIGNWVKHNNIPSTHAFPNEIFQVDVSFWFDIARNHLFMASIEPIKLTSEILEKCGFEHKILGDEELDGGESHYILNDIWFCHTDDEWFLSGAIKHKAFKYLHQLQNLYFALTEEELNIEL